MTFSYNPSKSTQHIVWTSTSLIQRQNDVEIKKNEIMGPFRIMDIIILRSFQRCIVVEMTLCAYWVATEFHENLLLYTGPRGGYLGAPPRIFFLSTAET